MDKRAWVINLLNTTDKNRSHIQTLSQAFPELGSHLLTAEVGLWIAVLLLRLLHGRQWLEAGSGAIQRAEDFTGGTGDLLRLLS